MTSCQYEHAEIQSFSIVEATTWNGKKIWSYNNRTTHAANVLMSNGIYSSLFRRNGVEALQIVHKLLSKGSLASEQTQTSGPRPG